MPACSSVVLLMLLITFRPHASVAGAAGNINIQLIHRDSPRSPLYNASATHFDCARAAAQRSALRACHIAGRASSNWQHAAFSSTNTDSIQAKLLPDYGEYLMEFEVGTPAFKIVAVADTGSDLIWTSCKPCSPCYKQIAPRFDPENSSTYRGLTCWTEACKSLPFQHCESQSTCEYENIYGDLSSVKGVLATDTFIFNAAGGISQQVSIPEIVFGCSHQSRGNFGNRTAGLVGLGAGQLSLVSQLSSSVDDNKFSYCLVPLSDNNSSSQLSIGPAALVSGSNAVTTPLIIYENFYYLSLQEIRVGNEKIPVPVNASATSPSPPPPGNGNIIIDSGTTLTILYPSVFQRLVQALKAMVQLPSVNKPGYEVLGVCFDTSGSGSSKLLPTITFEFAGAAQLELSPLNTFIAIEQHVMCLAATSNADVQLFGNMAQQNLHINYDLGAHKISFTHADCTKI